MADSNENTIMGIVKQSIQAHGRTGTWGVIAAAVSAEAAVVEPQALAYITTGDCVGAVAYMIGAIVAVAVTAIMIEAAGYLMTGNANVSE